MRDHSISDNQTDKPRKTRHIIATVAVLFFVFIVLYLTGFAVAVKLGPGLLPPVSTVLEYLYWPLIKYDANNIEPFNSRWRVGQNASHPDRIRTECHPKRSGSIGYYSPPFERSFVVDATAVSVHRHAS